MRVYIEIVIGIVIAMMYMYNIYIVNKCNLVTRWSVGYFFIILTSPVSLFTMITCMMADNYNRLKDIEDNCNRILTYSSNNESNMKLIANRLNSVDGYLNTFGNLLETNINGISNNTIRVDVLTATLRTIHSDIIANDANITRIVDTLNDIQSQVNGCVSYINSVQKPSGIIGKPDTNSDMHTGYVDAQIDDDSIRVVSLSTNVPTGELNVVMTQDENGVSFDPVKQ